MRCSFALLVLFGASVVLLLASTSCAEPVQHDDGDEAGDTSQQDNSASPPPLVIHLRGPSTVEISQTEAKTWIDPGSFVSQGGEGVAAELSWSIPKEINQGIVGTYAIEYTAVDLDTGKEAQSAERSVTVTDVDECELGPLEVQPFCSVHADCENTDGGFECHCKSGFTGDGFKCVDLDECESGDHECSEHADCTNTIGSYQCECHDGFSGDDGTDCVDVDECAGDGNNADCSQDATCTNTIGSYECACNEGYTGDGKYCEPIDKCETGTHDCHVNANCAKLPEGDFRCTCKDGFRGDGREVCDDIDECVENSAVCQKHSHCVNTIGSYDCECDDGFKLSANGTTCDDVDECLEETHDCSILGGECINTIGSFSCMCKDGYTGDGYNCRPLDAELDIILRGSDPLIMRQCDEFNDPGVDIVGREGRGEDVSISHRIPAALGAEFPSKMGEHIVEYHARVGNIHKSATRRVHIEGRDLSELPVSHSCRPSCPAGAELMFHAFDNYTCHCADGYYQHVEREDGTSHCQDIRPPVIALKGKQDHILLKCKVCSIETEPEVFLEERDGGFIAYDELPDGTRVDLTEKVQVTRKNVSYTEYELTYTVADEEGNEAEPVVRSVRIETEDIHERIIAMEEFLEANFAEFRAQRSWAFAIVLNAVWWTFAILCVIIIYNALPRFLNFLSAISSDKPSFHTYQSGYEFWYGITRPWMNSTDRSRKIHMEYTLKYHDKIDQ